MYAEVTVFTFALLGSAIAISECNSTIIDGLKANEKCYTSGNPPDNLQSSWRSTRVRLSKGVVDPSEVQCIIAQGERNDVQVTVHMKEGASRSYSVERTPSEDNIYLIETDPTGETYPQDAKYRIYVIHNEKGVYSYYRCTEGEVKGNTPGSHMVVVAIGCEVRTSEDARDVLFRAMDCFEALGIKSHDIDTLPACDDC